MKENFNIKATQKKLKSVLKKGKISETAYKDANNKIRHERSSIFKDTIKTILLFSIIPFLLICFFVYYRFFSNYPGQPGDLPDIWSGIIFYWLFGFFFLILPCFFTVFVILILWEKTKRINHLKIFIAPVFFIFSIFYFYIALPYLEIPNVPSGTISVKKGAEIFISFPHEIESGSWSIDEIKVIVSGNDTIFDFSKKALFVEKDQRKGIFESFDPFFPSIKLIIPKTIPFSNGGIFNINGYLRCHKDKLIYESSNERVIRIASPELIDSVSDAFSKSIRFRDYSILSFLFAVFGLSISLSSYFRKWINLDS